MTIDSRYLVDDQAQTLNYDVDIQSTFRYVYQSPIYTIFVKVLLGAHHLPHYKSIINIIKRL